MYWVVAATTGPPAHRPVRGVWLDELLQLSIGSPSLRTSIGAGGPVAVHLDGGTHVVIV